MTSRKLTVGAEFLVGGAAGRSALGSYSALIERLDLPRLLVNALVKLKVPTVIKFSAPIYDSVGMGLFVPSVDYRRLCGMIWIRERNLLVKLSACVEMRTLPSCMSSRLAYTLVLWYRRRHLYCGRRLLFAAGELFFELNAMCSC